MRILYTENYTEMSRCAADRIAAQILLKPDCVLGLATGGTPQGIYASLAERYRAGVLDFSEVRTVNLDEYAGLGADDPQSYHYYMKQYLFGLVNIAPEHTWIPDGKAEDPTAECQRYDDVIERLGGIDLQLLGIGNNGHIGFNEPADTFQRQTRLVDLNPSTIEANARFFSCIDEVPKKALTVGIGAILSARKILLVAAGKQKLEVIDKAFHGPITPQLPASILQLHPDVTIICCSHT